MFKVHESREKSLGDLVIATNVQKMVHWYYQKNVKQKKGDII